MTTEESLYTRLGGYDAIAAVADTLLKRLIADDRLGRFWAHRGQDGIDREKQFLIDFLSSNAGGPMLYKGRNMAVTHRGMRIDEADWTVFIEHVKATLDGFDVPAQEHEDVVAFIESTKGEIVE